MPEKGRGSETIQSNPSLHTMRKLRHPWSTFLQNVKYIIWEAPSPSTCAQMKLSDSNEGPRKHVQEKQVFWGPGRESLRTLRGILSRPKVRGFRKKVLTTFSFFKVVLM